MFHHHPIEADNLVLVLDEIVNYCFLFAAAWPQGQFIQQIPAEGYQQYPNGIYQTTYQQPAFETNTFYTGAVQVLTNARPPSAPSQAGQ